MWIIKIRAGCEFWRQNVSNGVIDENILDYLAFLIGFLNFLITVLNERNNVKLFWKIFL